MDTQTHARATGITDGGRVEVDDAEAALVEHYGRLVRIAYVTLPPSAGRHRRVLLAHRMVQRALPRGRRVPAPDPAGSGNAAYALVREAAVRGAVAFGRRRSGWRRLAHAVWTAAPLPPRVWGLRVFPRVGGVAELALDRTLAGLDAPARAAVALRGIERLSEEQAAALLERCGVVAPRRAVRRAAEAVRAADVRLLGSPDFDPCVLHARPSDLMRRRQHARAGAAAAVVVVLAIAVLGEPGAGDGSAAAGPSAAQRVALDQALDPASVLRGGASSWQRAGQLDFAAWPARGDRIHDAALLGRALAAWGRQGSGVRVTASAGTVRTPPIAPPRLLFAGNVDDAAVVLFYDGVRLVRYAEALDGDGPAALDFARADTASGSSAAAVVLDRSDGNVRYLTAPWVGGVALRDLLTPDAAAEPVHRAADGVTGPMPSAVRDPGCGAPAAQLPASGWSAVVLAPRAAVPGVRPLLLTDLGDLTPVHLTYAAGAGARQAEATGPQALAAWAHAACRLAALRGTGVRAAGTWHFADQPLPDGGGTAQWLCTRADLWSGGDNVLVQFLPPGSAANAPAAVSAAARSTAACGPIDPAVLSGVLWKSPARRWYLLAAGSPEVAGVTVSGGLAYSAVGRLAAVPAAPGTKARFTARLANGGSLSALR